ncbi:MAG: hypothetical protein LAT79_04645 [Kiritimatiellae bacterium]|nr:hypothetical protein [Kiritimatiellia bacterium]
MRVKTLFPLSTPRENNPLGIHAFEMIFLMKYDYVSFYSVKYNFVVSPVVLKRGVAKPRVGER